MGKVCATVSVEVSASGMTLANVGAPTHSSEGAVPIAAVCAVWGLHWQSQHMLVQYHNIAVVHVITA